jgi:hypothetical protein
MIESKDREEWRRRKRMQRWVPVPMGLGIAVFVLFVVYNSILVMRLASAGPEVSETVKEAFWLGWNGVSRTQTYAGYQIWIRDVLTGTLFSAMMLAALIVGGLITRRESRREERMWAHIEALERELAENRD